jgi:hypothetical protein
MNNGDSFLITIIIMFFLLLLFYFLDPIRYFNKPESFLDIKNDTYKLWPADKVINIQGNGIPDQETMPTKMDMSDPSLQSVDGTPDGPKSLFMFAYNKCDAKCCDKSPYSCEGGCVCITPEQEKLVIRH